MWFPAKSTSQALWHDIWQAICVILRNAHLFNFKSEIIKRKRNFMFVTFCSYGSSSVTAETWSIICIHLRSEFVLCSSLTKQPARPDLPSVFGHNRTERKCVNGIKWHNIWKFSFISFMCMLLYWSNWNCVLAYFLRVKFLISFPELDKICVCELTSSRMCLHVCVGRQLCLFTLVEAEHSWSAQLTWPHCSGSGSCFSHYKHRWGIDGLKSIVHIVWSGILWKDCCFSYISIWALSEAKMKVDCCWCNSCGKIQRFIWMLFSKPLHCF